MALFYYYDQNPFCFSFHIQTNNKSPNLHKKAKPLKDSDRSSKMASSCKWRITHAVNLILHKIY